MNLFGNENVSSIIGLNIVGFGRQICSKVREGCLEPLFFYEINVNLAAKPFDEVQKKVSELLKDRILVGHAVYNDLKVCQSSRRITEYPDYSGLGPSPFASTPNDTRYAVLRRETQGSKK